MRLSVGLLQPAWSALMFGVLCASTVNNVCNFATLGHLITDNFQPEKAFFDFHSSRRDFPVAF